MVSISGNIAEGDERFSNKESIRYLYIAKGSTAELLTQIIIAFEIGYIEDMDFNLKSFFLLPFYPFTHILIT